MKTLTEQQKNIYNNGERLILGVTHNLEEEIRHQSSYQFFKKVIEKDIATNQIKNKEITILDFGCGTGHGSRYLANIPNSKVTGVDISIESISYARDNYFVTNLDYIVTDIQKLIDKMPDYDYIVSRHAVEHIQNGLTLCLSLKWKQRLIINVPYNEMPGNEFHLLTNITKISFPKYNNLEFFYEDLKGVTFLDEENKNINSIIGIYSNKYLLPVRNLLDFPINAVLPNAMQILHGRVWELESKLFHLESKLNDINSLMAIKIMKKIKKILKKLIFYNLFVIKGN
ncbi:class I SAM-dependent methyltransferase [Crenothrix polyspora]|uniref:Methyltransferase n=1 Tax=Crenothrix polyspora TaxID=360316 RepID=A0A1R4HCU2_9GAMM|nr:methyltransferase domain-containing protein [Crenothrix polyspora]SJM94036.1 Methyltransferase [Crenothrix polyspora]